VRGFSGMCARAIADSPSIWSQIGWFGLEVVVGREEVKR